MGGLATPGSAELPQHDPQDIRRYAAAGGVVVAPDGEKVLILMRPGRQDPDGRAEMRLPKGHIEPGESQQQAALREVREETGLAATSVVAPLGHQAVEFDWQGVHHLRQEYYFLLHALDEQGTASSEAQFKPLWLGWDEALKYITFEAEREWIRRARSVWEARTKER